MLGWPANLSTSGQHLSFCIDCLQTILNINGKGQATQEIHVFQYEIISHNLVDLPLTMGQFIADDDLFDDNEVAMLGVTVCARAQIKYFSVFLLAF